MKTEETYELIDRYLNGSLSETELVSFENVLSANPEMKSLVQKQKMANEYILENRLHRLKTKMQSDIDSGYADQLILKHTLKRWMWRGLGLVLVSSTAYVAFLYAPEKESIQNTSSTQEVQNTTPSRQSEKPVAITSDTHKKQIEKENIHIPQNLLLNTESKTTTNTASESETKEIEEVTPEKETKAVATPAIVIEQVKTEHTQPTDPCLIQNISLKGSPSETCVGKNEGTLDLNIQGGTPPYRCGIKKTGSAEISWNKPGSTFFSELGANSYEVVIKDHKGCTHASTQTFVVKSKPCSQTELKEYAFRPEYQEQLQMPIEKNGNIVLYNRGGQEIYQAPVYAGTEFTWDGSNRYGMNTEKGIYLFVIQHQDGTSKKGYITVY